MKAVRAAPARSGAFADAVISAAPARVPAQRSEARAVPSAATRQPDTRTNAGAELPTAVHRLSSTRGFSTSDTTVPGRTQSRRATAAPGPTTTSARPAAQLPDADTDGLPPVGLAPLSDAPPTCPPLVDA
ncbi:hypothetical protein [Streptomyces hokutonensis]|uniref:hypothetical protein n=1 Tax=Streptomyces hokutonensis TaxID=1306990 RepID=UPI003828BF4A